MFDPSMARTNLARMWARETKFGIERVANPILIEQILGSRMHLVAGMRVLRDELEEWCRLLLKLELWDELRLAAHALRERAENGADPARTERAWLLAATAELRQDLLPSAKHSLDSIDPNPRGERDHVMRVWLARAELARRQGERSQERYALLLVTRTVPLDPPPPVRAEIGRAWQRLARDLDLNKLGVITSQIPLDDVPLVAEEIVAGKVRGRVVVDL